MKWLAAKQQRTGFTLIEVMVVVGIIGILAAVVTLSVRDSSTGSRDAKRQADLRLLQTAIETYKNENGRYPQGCRGADQWSGQLDTIYVCNSAVSSTYAGTGQYIIGLAPKYISVLPVDPKLNGTDSGYIYTTNAAGTVYKLKAHRTVEAEVVTYQHPLKACDIKLEQSCSGGPCIGSTDPRVRGWCGYTEGSGGVLAFPSTCSSQEEGYNRSYAVWGGQAPLVESLPSGSINIYAPDPLATVTFNPPTNPLNQVNLNRNRAIKNTTDIICK